MFKGTAYLFILLATGAYAREACGPHPKVGTSCWLHVKKAKPTQFALGIREVIERQEEMEDMGENKLEKYLEENTAPVILGPGMGFYITDRHHLARAAWEADVTWIVADIKEDWSNKAPEDFWKAMKAAKYVFLQDQFGHAQPPELLPENVLGMGDDWYRSIAWSVRKKGGYAKTDVLYAEFQWANFFRTRINKIDGDDAYKAAVKTGVDLALSPAAKGLPGYLGK